MPTPVSIRTESGVRVLSHAFREVPMPDGSIMLDLSANGGDDGEGVDLHASTHFVGGTDSLASEYANIADLTVGAYTIPMASVDPGVSNSVIIAGSGASLDAITNGGAGTVLRGGTPGGGLTGIDFGPVTDSHFGGQLLLAHGGTGLSSYTAGDTLYYSSGTALSKLGIGASGTIYTSTGSAPQWVASLTKAQQHAQTAYLDGTTSFTATQSFTGASSSTSVMKVFISGEAFPRLDVNAAGTLNYGGGAAAADLLVERDAAGAWRLRGGTTNGAVRLTLRPANTIGGAGGDATLALFDGGQQCGRFIATLSAAAGSRTFSLEAQSDRDGNRIPLFFSALNAAGTAVRSLTCFAAADAGKVGIGPALGVNLGVGVVPSAVFHVVETSAGAVPETVRLGNQSTTSGSGTEIGFHASTSGGQKYASIQAVTTAASAANGDIVLAAQKASSGGPLERLRILGAKECLFIANGTAAPGTPVGGGYLQVVGGALKFIGSSGTITTLAVA